MRNVLVVRRFVHSDTKLTKREEKRYTSACWHAGDEEEEVDDNVNNALYCGHDSDHLEASLQEVSDDDDDKGRQE